MNPLTFICSSNFSHATVCPNRCARKEPKNICGVVMDRQPPTKLSGKGHIRAALREDAYECLKTMILAGKVICEVLPGKIHIGVYVSKNKCSQGTYI